MSTTHTDAGTNTKYPTETYTRISSEFQPEGSRSEGTPRFTVVSASAVSDTLSGRAQEVLDLVKQTYLRHDAGRTVNPPSSFLRFPDRPDDRIIALPASIADPDGVDGIKWVASVPGNIDRGLQRATALLLLNQPGTGFPYACLEGSQISAARTAASAALAAAQICSASDRETRRVGFVGAGPIAVGIRDYLQAAGITMTEIGVHDLRPERAELFARESGASPGTTGTVYASTDELIRSHDIIVFATVAGSPHVHDPQLFTHSPLVLNVSLRDLAPDVILSAHNLVDDVEHCLKANTSVHLAEQEVGHRDFLAGTLADVLQGRVTPPADQTVVFSPFGLGVLDIALGAFIAERARSHPTSTELTGFFDPTATGKEPHP